jgi:hypothetical protein
VNTIQIHAAANWRACPPCTGECMQGDSCPRRQRTPSRPAPLLNIRPRAEARPGWFWCTTALCAIEAAALAWWALL